MDSDGDARCGACCATPSFAASVRQPPQPQPPMRETADGRALGGSGCGSAHVLPLPAARAPYGADWEGEGLPAPSPGGVYLNEAQAQLITACMLSLAHAAAPSGAGVFPHEAARHEAQPSRAAPALPRLSIPSHPTREQPGAQPPRPHELAGEQRDVYVHEDALGFHSPAGAALSDLPAALHAWASALLASARAAARPAAAAPSVQGRSATLKLLRSDTYTLPILLRAPTVSQIRNDALAHDGFALLVGLPAVCVSWLLAASSAEWAVLHVVVYAAYLFADSVWLGAFPHVVRSVLPLAVHHCLCLALCAAALLTPDLAEYAHWLTALEANSVLMALRRYQPDSRPLDIAYFGSYVALRLLWFPAAVCVALVELQPGGRLSAGVIAVCGYLYVLQLWWAAFTVPWPASWASALAISRPHAKGAEPGEPELL